MTSQPLTQAKNKIAQVVHYFPRFTLAQRWEHTLLLLSITVLVLTGLPQKYRDTHWSQTILATPQSVILVQQVHHIAALVLTLEVIYHLGNALYLMSRRRLPGDMLPTWQDVKDAGQMIKYLLFLSKDKPAFGKYNFEQKFTYWFLAFSIGILVVTGFILWFPVQATWLFPGGMIPAAKMAHSTEAVVTVIFILIWHFYHVHIERLNLSIFTGKVNEEDMQAYHTKEYKRLMNGAATPKRGGKQ